MTGIKTYVFINKSMRKVSDRNRNLLSFCFMLLFSVFLDIFSKFCKKQQARSTIPRYTGTVWKKSPTSQAFDQEISLPKPSCRRSTCHLFHHLSQCINGTHDKLSVWGFHHLVHVWNPIPEFVWGFTCTQFHKSCLHSTFDTMNLCLTLSFSFNVEHPPVAENLFCVNVCWVLAYFSTFGLTSQHLMLDGGLTLSEISNNQEKTSTIIDS